MNPLTIPQALAWPDPPAGALSWLEPHLVCESSGIWVVWYLTDGRRWHFIGCTLADI
jgi:hypothetical protein